MAKEKFIKTSKVRGIPVPHNKSTQDSATRPLISPPSVTLVMTQHIGAPAVICVEKDQPVFVGTLVGRAASAISANIHSSVSGKVIQIFKLNMPNGDAVDAVLIESDELFTPDPALKPPVVTNAAELADAVAQSGLVGLGGAGFPTHVKLRVPEDAHVDTLVINAAECEPYLTTDYREMMENTDEVMEGILLVKRMLGLSRAVIGIENNKPQAIALLKERAAALDNPQDIEIAPLRSAYPQGAERFLIANLTRRMVPAGKLPSDAGVIILNVSTVAFIARYLKTGLPLVSRRLTVDGGAVKNPGNLMVPIGTAIIDVIKACGGYAEQCAKLLMGGPMMGIALYADDFPTLKNNNGILALSPAEVELTADHPCIRCGRCVDTCPMRLSPAEIQTAYTTEDPEWARRMGVQNCIECGCCTFVCPAKRPITQMMRLCKEQIRKADKK